MSKQEFKGSGSAVGSYSGTYASLGNYAPTAMSGPTPPVSVLAAVPNGANVMRLPQFGMPSYVGANQSAIQSGFTTVTNAYPVSQCQATYNLRSCQ